MHTISARVIAALFLASVMATAIVKVRAEPERSTQQIHSKLYLSSRERLVGAIAHGATTFNVVIASVDHKNASVARAIVADGGAVRWRADDVDYLRAVLPIGAVEKIAEDPNVESIDADDVAYLLEPTPRPSSTVSPAATPWSRSAAEERPLLHPYRPGADIGTLALRAKYPTYDGRGTVVAIIDGIPDFLLPELQESKSLSGERIPKFIDIRSESSADRYSPWLDTSAVRVVGGTFTVGGVSYKAPYDGIFRFVRLRRSQASYAYLFKVADLGSADSQRDGIGVLWDERTGAVWVDSSRNHDFADESAVHDYSVDHTYVTFPVKVTDPEARPSVGCVIHTDQASHRVALLCGTAFHASGSSGTVAASLGKAGRIEGIAPGAQLEIIEPTGTLSSIIEATIVAARDPRVDIIDMEIVSGPGYSPKDGRFTDTIVHTRLTHRYRKLFVEGTDDFGGVSSLFDQCVPDVTLCVDSYESSASRRINLGMQSEAYDNLHDADAFGPAGDGALKPDILAPAGWLSLGPGYTAERGLRKGVYNLPPGYVVFGGVSQAAPAAAGAAAVLLSAARQEHLEVSPKRIVEAMSESARYLRNLPAYTQGNGLVQVDAALQWLRRWSGRTTPQIVFRAPVRTATSWMLPIPDEGKGFYEREGWYAGASGTRTIWITRKTGTASPLDVLAKFVGNDGTFSEERGTISLPLNTPVSFILRVAPRTSGVHSALLRLSTLDGVRLGETMLTVVAGEQFSRRDGYTVTKQIRLPRLGKSSVFLTTPTGTDALILNVASSRTEDFWLRFEPYGPDGGSIYQESGKTTFDGPVAQGERRYVFSHPRPGTWEIVFYDMSDRMKFEGAAPAPTRIDVRAGIVNRSEHPAWISLFTKKASARVLSFGDTLDVGQHGTYVMSVPAGAVLVGAQARSAKNGIVHLYLFDCTNRILSGCVLVAKSVQHGANQYINWPSSSKGVWKVIVDQYQGSKNGSPFRLQAYYVLSRRVRNQSGQDTCSHAATTPVATRTIFGNEPATFYENSAGATRLVPAGKGLVPLIFDVELSASPCTPMPR